MLMEKHTGRQTLTSMYKKKTNMTKRKLKYQLIAFYSFPYFMKSHSRNSFLFLQSSYSVQFAEVLFSVFYTSRELMHVNKRMLQHMGRSD